MAWLNVGNIRGPTGPTGSAGPELPEDANHADLLGWFHPSWETDGAPAWMHPLAPRWVLVDQVDVDYSISDHFAFVTTPGPSDMQLEVEPDIYVGCQAGVYAANGDVTVWCGAPYTITRNGEVGKPHTPQGSDTSSIVVAQGNMVVVTWTGDTWLVTTDTQRGGGESVPGGGYTLVYLPWEWNDDWNDFDDDDWEKFGEVYGDLDYEEHQAQDGELIVNQGVWLVRVPENPVEGTRFAVRNEGWHFTPILMPEEQYTWGAAEVDGEHVWPLDSNRTAEFIYHADDDRWQVVMGQTLPDWGEDDQVPVSRWAQFTPLPNAGWRTSIRWRNLGSLIPLKTFRVIDTWTSGLQVAEDGEFLVLKVPSPNTSAVLLPPESKPGARFRVFADFVAGEVYFGRYGSPGIPNPLGEQAGITGGSQFILRPGDVAELVCFPNTVDPDDWQEDYDWNEYQWYIVDHWQYRPLGLRYARAVNQSGGTVMDIRTGEFTISRGAGTGSLYIRSGFSLDQRMASLGGQVTVYAETRDRIVAAAPDNIIRNGLTYGQITVAQGHVVTLTRTGATEWRVTTDTQALLPLIARAFRNAALTIAAANTAQQVPLDGFQILSAAGISGGQFVCPRAGIYEVAYQVSASATAAGQTLWAILRHNGVNVAQFINHSGAASQRLTSGGVTAVNCASGDNLQLWVQSSAALGINNDSASTYLVVKLPPP